MKKIAILLVGLFLFSNLAFAEDIQLPKQDVEVDMAGAVFLLNKQPKTESNIQTIKIRRSGLVFVGNINGKVDIQKQQNK